jgi:hypothetical protein
MPEPIFTESVTDLDGYDAGELEFEVNGFDFRALRGGALDLQASAEAEWLVTRRLGVRLEPFVAGSRDGTRTSLEKAYGAGAAISWKLVQDYVHDFHVQAELSGRAPWDSATSVEPGDSPLPLTFDIRSGIREGRCTVRGSVGGGVGASVAHVPVRASLAVLTPLGPSERFGFIGMEADVDGARAYPVVLALDVVPELSPLHLPFRLGLAIPWAVGVESTQPSIGLLLRLFWESPEEQAYGEGRRATTSRRAEGSGR